MQTRHGDQCISKVQPELTEVLIRENFMPYVFYKMAMFMDLYNLVKT